MVTVKRTGVTGTLISLAVLGVGTVLLQIVAPLVAAEIGQEYPYDQATADHSELAGVI